MEIRHRVAGSTRRSVSWLPGTDSCSGPRRGAWMLLRRGAMVAAAVVIAVVAVVLFAHGGRRAAGRGGVTRPTGAIVGQGCGRVLLPGSRRRALATVARGSIGGHRWAVLAVRPRRIIPVGVEAFVLDGHAYSVCGNAAGLVDARPHGILYVFLVGSGPFALTLPGAEAAVTRRVGGGTFFVFALRRSACAYRTLALSVTGGGHTLAAALRFEAPCLRNQVVPSPPPRNPSTLVPLRAPARLSGAKRSEFLAGEVVVGETGCLACHAIGKIAPGSPVGPNLGHVGSLLRPAAIRSALLHPTPPMPSFRELSRRKLRALTYFLSQLRSGG